MNFLSSAVSSIKPRLDDSGTDRLNYYYSTMVIMVLSVTITAKQYVGSPLQCWVPAQFTKAWEQYAENYCFVYNTYWVRPDEDIPTSVEKRHCHELVLIFSFGISPCYQMHSSLTRLCVHAAFAIIRDECKCPPTSRDHKDVPSANTTMIEIGVSRYVNQIFIVREVIEIAFGRVAQQLIYYQWVPFIMALEAAFFYLPVVFWSQMNNKSGLNVENLVRLAVAAETAEDSSREKKLSAVCSHLERSVELQMARRDGASLFAHITKFGQLDGTYVSNVYLITKIFYVINLVVQFLMMNRFLGQNDPYWGLRILSDILTGTNWEHSGNFPRIAMCDFQVRVLGNLQRYSIQCVLSLNMFNEKIFLFLYFWFILVGIATTIDAINLVLTTRLNSQKIEFVRKFIKPTTGEQMLLGDFCIFQVNPDMILILNMIGAHANDVISSEILQQMWKNYKKRREAMESDSNFPQKTNGDLDETKPLMFA